MGIEPVHAVCGVTRESLIKTFWNIVVSFFVTQYWACLIMVSNYVHDISKCYFDCSVILNIIFFQFKLWYVHLWMDSYHLFLLKWSPYD